MKKIFGLISAIIIGSIVLTGNSIYDKILGSIIAVIGYYNAFTLVGNLGSLVDYDSIIMSFLYWTFYTIIVLGIIFVMRFVYRFLNVILSTFVEKSEIVSVVICSVSLIVIAEVLKGITGLKKSYW